MGVDFSLPQHIVDAGMAAARDNLGQERFNQAWNSVPSWLVPDAIICQNGPGVSHAFGILGWDCSHWEQFDPEGPLDTGFDADNSGLQQLEMAADAVAADTFQANFDAAWNRYNQPPPILRDAQGTPLEPEGPATIQGFPQRIRKPPGVQTKALPENEPQRVYNQDDSSEEPQLAIAESASPGLPLMTIGAVAIGGVLIFLWSRRE